jgi:hypothetical protein
VEHVFTAFPGLRENEMKRYGEFTTERLVLECYDAMAGADSPEGAPGHAQ